MSKAVIGFYEDVSDARQVVDHLVNAGFSREGIHFMTQHEGDREMVVGVGGASRTPSGASASAEALTRMGVPRDEAAAYVEGIRRGGNVVALVVPDDRAPEASRIMEGGKAVDISERTASWRREGWEPSSIYGGTQPGVTTTPGVTGERPTTTEEPEGHIELVEEDIKVGKRRVEDTGGVRVRTHVVEEPVEEDIRLREEQVHVERRPVDRPAGPEDIDRGLREETIELRESSEEPVVSKEARVTEEIDVGKETTERVETIRDTVRRTEAEVEELGKTGKVTGPSDLDETPFRQHYQTTLASRGYDYDHYLPAYRYGATLAQSGRFRNKSWDEVMPEAQNAWESRNPGTWNDYMDAVREGFIRTSGRSMARGR
jgi:uncharacterized protein (TIGR02271 family)